MFEFEPGLIIWTSVSFGLLVLLLYRVALPPLLVFLAQREQTIVSALAEAVESRKKAEAELGAVKLRLAEASQKAEKIVEQAKLEGEKLKTDIVKAARQESEMVAAKAKEELHREKNALLAEVQQRTADLVAAAAGRILRRKIDPSEDRRLIEESLQECQL